jgi:hypothetical protein
LFLELIRTFGVLGEPTFLYAVFLFKDLLDGPERRESKYAQEGRNQDILYAKRGHNAPDAQYKKNPPALGTPIILGFHYHRMKQSDDKKCTNADEQSRKMIFV